MNGRALECVATLDSNRKIWWQCTKACDDGTLHAWRATPRVKDKLGCQVCADLVVCRCSNRCNSLVRQQPELAKKWATKSNIVWHPHANPENVTLNDTRQFCWEDWLGYMQCTILKLMKRNGRLLPHSDFYMGRRMWRD
jgi:hypothetical protein